MISVNPVDYRKNPIDILFHLREQALVFRAVIPILSIRFNDYDALEWERSFYFITAPSSFRYSIRAATCC